MWYSIIFQTFLMLFKLLILSVHCNYSQQMVMFFYHEENIKHKTRIKQNVLQLLDTCAYFYLFPSLRECVYLFAVVNFPPLLWILCIQISQRLRTVVFETNSFLLLCEEEYRCWRAVCISIVRHILLKKIQIFTCNNAHVIISQRSRLKSCSKK